MVKKLIYFLILIILFTTNVYADTFDTTSQTKINNNYLPDYYLVNAGQNRSFILRFEDWQLRSQQPFYANFLYLKVCSTKDFYVYSQANCTTGCINSEIYVANAGGSCDIGNGTYGKNYYIFYSVDSWAMMNYDTVPYIQDNLTIYHDHTNYIAVRFNENYITNENTYIDFASNGNIEDLQKQTNSKLDGIHSSINNQTNAINNQTNAINNQTNSINSRINNQTNAINNQTNAINNQTNAINNQTNKINNTINDDTVSSPSSDIADFNNFIATNSTISSLLTLPVSLFTKVLDSLNSTCSSYDLGEFKGTHIILPCINISAYIGATLFNVIDVLISGIFVYNISRKFVKVFENMSSMKDGDIIND